MMKLLCINCKAEFTHHKRHLEDFCPTCKPLQIEEHVGYKSEADKFSEWCKMNPNYDTLSNDDQKEVAIEYAKHVMGQVFKFFTLRENYLLDQLKVRPVYVVQHTKTMIIHGCFESREKAVNYINGADYMAVKQLQIS